MNWPSMTGKEASAEETPLEVGAKAPDFVLQNERGESWRLFDQRGRVVALLFYPANETLVCTKQLCSVRDDWASYIATGALIAGVSPGTPQEHKEFAEHHNLPLALLADTNGAVTKKYTNVWWLPWRATRSLVVIDAKGFVRYRKVMLRAFRPRNSEVLAAVRSAQYDELISRNPFP